MPPDRLQPQAIVSPQPAASAWQGVLKLDYRQTDRGTQLDRSFATAPLKIQRPFFPEGPHVCHSVLLHTAGGIVSGDRLQYDITLHPNAQAVITTAAASKIYKAKAKAQDSDPAAFLQAQQHITIRIEPGACLEWLPQETIVFESAHFQQSLHIDLAPGAHWFGWDITRFGRSARGERFLAGDWRSLTEVWQNGQPLWLDRQWLPGSETTWNSPHGLACQPVVASFAYLGTLPDPALIETIRQRWHEMEPVPTSKHEIGVTRLQKGLLCRYRGPSTIEARQRFLVVWDLVRREYCQRPLCLPRVWQS